MGKYTLEEIASWIEYGLRECSQFRWEDITLDGTGNLINYLKKRGYNAFLESAPRGEIDTELKYDLVVRRADSVDSK